MMRLIDADALADNIAVLFERNQALIDEWLMYYVEDAIDEAPTIDAEPVRHGHWIYFEQDNMFGCSKCARWMPRNNYLYCPWCGAKMDEVNDEAN